VPKPFLTSLSIGISWIKLHTSFRVWSLSSLQLVSKMIENIWHNFTPTSKTVNKDNDDQVFSSIFKYFFKSPKKHIIRVCLNRIESMSLLWLLSRLFPEFRPFFASLFFILSFISLRYVSSFPSISLFLFCLYYLSNVCISFKKPIFFLWVCMCPSPRIVMVLFFWIYAPMLYAPL
jgi:hypothetical protein